MGVPTGDVFLLSALQFAFSEDFGFLKLDDVFKACVYQATNLFPVLATFER
jgi:hypothetical protein